MTEAAPAPAAGTARRPAGEDFPARPAAVTTPSCAAWSAPDVSLRPLAFTPGNLPAPAPAARPRHAA